MGKNSNWSQTTSVESQVCLYLLCDLECVVKCYIPPFPHLQNGVDNDNTYLIMLL